MELPAFSVQLSAIGEQPLAKMAGDMKDFRSLKVWEKAHSLTLEIYKESAVSPDCERYGLTSQLRRSTASICANIAEGCGRDSDSEPRRFLQIAMGSASETEYHLLLARDLNMLESGVYRRLNENTQEIKKMLASFIKKLIADR